MAAPRNQSARGKRITKDHLKKKQPLTRTLLVPLTDEDTIALKEAREENGTAGLLGQPERMEAAAKRLKETEDRVRREGLEFRFVGIGRRRYEELLRKHPPTAEQQAEAEKEGASMTFNPDTFIPALLAETVANSDLTADEWREDVLDSDDWGQGEIAELIGYAMSVNRESRVADLGN